MSRSYWTPWSMIISRSSGIDIGHRQYPAGHDLKIDVGALAQDASMFLTMGLEPVRRHAMVLHQAFLGLEMTLQQATDLGKTSLARSEFTFAAGMAISLLTNSVRTRSARRSPANQSVATPSRLGGRRTTPSHCVRPPRAAGPERRGRRMQCPISLSTSSRAASTAAEAAMNSLAAIRRAASVLPALNVPTMSPAHSWKRRCTSRSVRYRGLSPAETPRQHESISRIRRRYRRARHRHPACNRRRRR